MVFPGQSSDAERVLQALEHAHAQFTFDAKSEAELPAWFLLTSAGPIRIKTIGTFRSFMQFTTSDDHIVLIAPDAVAVTMQTLKPESEEPRFEIGFRSPST